MKLGQNANLNMNYRLWIWITVNQVHVKFVQRATATQAGSNQEVTKMTDKHASEYSKTACFGVI